MNKAQRKCVAESLSAILYKLEKCEDHLAVAQNEGGDPDLIARLSARIECLSGELRGADNVLHMLGYARRYHDNGERGYYTVEKL